MVSGNHRIVSKRTHGYKGSYYNCAEYQVSVTDHIKRYIDIKNIEPPNHIEPNSLKYHIKPELCDSNFWGGKQEQEVIHRPHILPFPSI